MTPPDAPTLPELATDHGLAGARGSGACPGPARGPGGTPSGPVAASAGPTTSHNRRRPLARRSWPCRKSRQSSGSLSRMPTRWAAWSRDEPACA